MELSAVHPWGAPATAATIGSAGPSPPPMVSAPGASGPWGTASADPWGVASPTSPTSTDPWGGGAPPPSIAPPPDPWGETANNRVNNTDPWGSSGKLVCSQSGFPGTLQVSQRSWILHLLAPPPLPGPLCFNHHVLFSVASSRAHMLQFGNNRSSHEWVVPSQQQMSVLSFSLRTDWLSLHQSALLCPSYSSISIRPHILKLLKQPVKPNPLCPPPLSSI